MAIRRQGGPLAALSDHAKKFGDPCPCHHREPAELRGWELSRPTPVEDPEVETLWRTMAERGGE